jgi:hypothetical protein
MAKCTQCNSRKGKRKCKATETFICSLCCGENREQEKCEGCSFFRSASAGRNYRSVPHYSTQEMADSFELEGISEVIETALCRVWAADGKNVNDRAAARLVELLLDKYHFNDDTPQIDDPVLATGHQLLSRTISEELPQVPAEKLVKVLAAVSRSIQRRTIGGSSYLEFVSQFTGVGYDNRSAI